MRWGAGKKRPAAMAHARAHKAAAGSSTHAAGNAGNGLRWTSEGQQKPLGGAFTLHVRCTGGFWPCAGRGDCRRQSAVRCEGHERLRIDGAGPGPGR